MKYRTIKLGILLASLCGLASAANIAEVAKTSPGNTGAAGAGKEWPTTRFVGSGDCVTDNLTGLMWAKNGIIGFEATNGGALLAQPNYTNTTANLNNVTWANAATAIDNMNTAVTKLCGYSDWRLPNINELKSLVNYAAKQSGSTPAAWLISAGFSNVQAVYYWSSTAYNGSNAWYVGFGAGNSYYDSTGISYYVLPVRGGQ